MKKKFLPLLGTFLLLSLSSCNSNSPSISNYSIDTDGNLIANYDDGSAQIIGDFEEEIVNGINSINIDSNGYFIINGVTTDINLQTISKSLNIQISDDGYYVINGNKTDIKFEIKSIEISDDGYYIVNGIKTNILATKMWTVSFDTGFEGVVRSQSVLNGGTVNEPDIYRKGYTLEGWFYNDSKWDFNSDLVTSNMVLTAERAPNKYTITFDTGFTDLVLEPMDVFFEVNYQLPIPSKEGYTFKGWKYETQDFDNNGTRTIMSDISLEAEWTTNQYKVTLDPNGGSLSSTVFNVTYGENFTLPIPIKEVGVFKGWFLGEAQITDKDGVSLSPWTFTQNITLTTNWIDYVSTADDLKKINEYPNGYFVLQNDIDLKSEEWSPLLNGENFTGILDGNGFSIKNLTITNNHNFVGLFGKSSGIIRNLSLENVNVNLSVTESDLYVGSLCGENSGIIENIKTSGNIYVPNHSSAYNSYVGGVVGGTSRGLDKIINSCVVSAPIISGGVAGMVSGAADFSFLKNDGKVYSDYIAGGLVGYCSSNSKFTSCINNGNVDGKYYVGGLCGTSYLAVSGSSNRKITFNVCGNNGNVSSSSQETLVGTGGLIGAASSLSCVDVYNKGNITGSVTGGIYGYANSDVYILRSYSSGTISGKNQTAGLGGLSTSSNVSFFDSVVFGSINSSLSSNSIVGYPLSTPTLRNCYYNCSAGSYLGEKTQYNFEKEFYLSSLFWNENTWKFNDSDYPSLNINFEF